MKRSLSTVLEAGCSFFFSTSLVDVYGVRRQRDQFPYKLSQRCNNHCVAGTHPMHVRIQLPPPRSRREARERQQVTSPHAFIDNRLRALITGLTTGSKLSYARTPLSAPSLSTQSDLEGAPKQWAATLFVKVHMSRKKKAFWSRFPRNL